MLEINLTLTVFELSRLRAALDRSDALSKASSAGNWTVYVKLSDAFTRMEILAVKRQRRRKRQKLYRRDHRKMLSPVKDDNDDDDAWSDTIAASQREDQ